MAPERNAIWFIPKEKPSSLLGVASVSMAMLLVKTEGGADSLYSPENDYLEGVKAYAS